ncbi:MAG TPA: hypothetical protein DD727_07680 [Clostridiales bacterium]|nr:hypothetical protein [Clostridiales bacterium]
MTDENPRNMYKVRRKEAVQVKASREGIKWDMLNVTGISVHGMEFLHAKPYSSSELLQLSFCIHGKLSEFCFKTWGRIVQVQKPAKNGFQYTLRFEALEMMHQIQLDEILKSQVNDFCLESGESDSSYRMLI